MAMTDEERIEMTSMPEGTIETPKGTISLSFIKPGCILAVAGMNTGWLRLNDVPYYAAARFIRNEADGKWESDPRNRIVALVRDGKASDAAPPITHAVGMASLHKALTDWLDANPDLLPRANLAAANGWLIQKEDHLGQLEDQLERMRWEVREARKDRDAAQAELDAVLSAGGPSIGR